MKYATDRHTLVTVALTCHVGFTILKLNNVKPSRMEDVILMVITSEQKQNAHGNVEVCYICIQGN